MVFLIKDHGKTTFDYTAIAQGVKILSLGVKDPLIRNWLAKGLDQMVLPKVVQVTIAGELVELLTRAKAEQPDASWSKLVGRAAKYGFKSFQEPKASEPSLAEEYEGLEV